MLHASKIVFLGVATHYNILRHIADAESKLCLQVRGQNGKHFRKKWQIVFWLCIGWPKRENGWLMYHTIARGGADSEQNGIFCAYCWRTHSSSATNSTFATMRAKISVGTHYAVNHMVGGLKFLFDFLNSQTRQTNSFKSCNSHINACRDAASTESKCLYSWLDSGMQIWDQQPELWRRRGSWKYQRVSNVSVYRCHGETEPSSNRC